MDFCGTGIFASASHCWSFKNTQGNKSPDQKPGGFKATLKVKNLAWEFLVFSTYCMKTHNGVRRCGQIIRSSLTATFQATLYRRFPINLINFGVSSCHHIT